MLQGDSLALLRDAFGSWSIALRCLSDADENHSNANLSFKQSHADGALALYVLSEMNAAVIPLPDRCRGHALQHVCLGRLDGGTVYLAVPTPGAIFADATLAWAFYAQTEMTIQYMARCRIAQLQTIGGGWASLCRADKALVCAMALYHLATNVVYDDDIASKARVFIGWAHLWNGNVAKAIALFELELQDALSRGDIVHERRCRHAIINATTNAQLLRSLRRGAFSLTDCWTSAFTATEIEEVNVIAAARETREHCNE